MSDIAHHLQQVQAQIATAAGKAGRAPDEIQLLAVSKTKPLSAIQEAYAAGQRRFGESYAQEAVLKVQAAQAAGLEIEWHFIGPLQSNKTRPVAAHFDWVDSVDRLKIAERLNEQRPDSLPPLNVCIQVNISGESQKSGTTDAAVFDLARAISALPRLRLRGLMAIAENTDDEGAIQRSFSQLHDLFVHLHESFPSMDTLSMGMTQDLEIAVASGSTQVRIGTAIFGAREYRQE
ncbi:YggS family pyridoxal phosphate-dependent enzyme [Pseudaeromonas sharmana]|uniref:Pyridoxal phosphate homeostasis protein n=1 Tax=Pseudaeromonas sharmana TaxID=328412 RepID=A0ABV8CM51_9GAMM